jgi:hypothetical protein
VLAAKASTSFVVNWVPSERVRSQTRLNPRSTSAFLSSTNSTNLVAVRKSRVPRILPTHKDLPLRMETSSKQTPMHQAQIRARKFTDASRPHPSFGHLRPSYGRRLPNHPNCDCPPSRHHYCHLGGIVVVARGRAAHSALHLGIHALRIKVSRGMALIEALVALLRVSLTVGMLLLIAL